MRRQTAIAIDFLVLGRGVQVLDQTAAMIHIQKLKPTADRQDGQIAFERFPA